MYFVSYFSRQAFSRRCTFLVQREKHKKFVWEISEEIVICGRVKSSGGNLTYITCIIIARVKDVNVRLLRKIIALLKYKSHDIFYSRIFIQEGI